MVQGCMDPPAQGTVSHILDEDPELGAPLPAAEREVATRVLCARVISVAPGQWAPPPITACREFGVLVLDGLMARRGRLVGAVAIEILGPGDLLRPCDRPAFTEVVTPAAEWEVLQAARLAVLDERVSEQIAQWPELAIALSGRLSRRVSNLNHLLAISHLPRVEDRLLATLRFLAGHYGRVRADGVTVPLRLTHGHLGELVGARRPSVSLALKSLCARGLVCRCPGGGYVVYGDVPAVLSTSLSVPVTADR